MIRLLAGAAVLVMLLRPEWMEPLLAPLTRNGAPAIYTQSSLLGLTLLHLALVAAATLASALVAVALAVLVTRRAGAEFRPLARTITQVGQTLPPVAVLALAVPMLGFGTWPTLLALFLYGMLPIFENALTALSGLPPPVAEAARAMGYTPRQRLLKIELPLALPVILAGVRLSAVIALSTAAIGSTVAARTLGEVIIAGLVTNNPAFVVQGGLLVGLIAILLSDALTVLERRVSPYGSSGTRA
ncbi:ABC transporter permease [Falsirhodobacter xinxiangensis]|uniref:ABC transporter permease n=1 Tax=Falsirhodobacter xinxiangensis TaxID=2530049 RepID=UPI0010AADC56|nr:ABC transporter permease [Rhodobacter xinxiangensis]